MPGPEDFKLSFSSSLVPDRDLSGLIELAKEHGYAGLELVMPEEDTEPHAHATAPDLSPTRLAAVKHELIDSGLEVSCLATGLVFNGAADSAEVVEELRKHVSLAEALACRCVRVFGGGVFGLEGEIAGKVDAVADGLAEAVAFAEQTDVSVLLQTWGDFSTTKYIREIVKQIYSEHFGVLWDLQHPIRALETIEESYDNIANQVKLVHVQDFRYSDGRSSMQAVPLGEGIVPFAKAIQFLAHDGFQGYLSVEAGVGKPEEVLPEYAELLAGYVQAAFEPVEKS